MALKTKKGNTDNSILLDMVSLQSVLNCGRYTCEKIAREAGARVQIGRRVLYDRQKIEHYLETLAN